MLSAMIGGAQAKEVGRSQCAAQGRGGSKEAAQRECGLELARWSLVTKKDSSELPISLSPDKLKADNLTLNAFTLSAGDQSAPGEGESPLQNEISGGRVAME